MGLLTQRIVSPTWGPDSCTSVLSEAQIEIQRQMETNRIMADLRLAKLAWEEKQAQLAHEERQAQQEEKEAELKAKLALKEAALKAEFLKKGLECRKSRSGKSIQGSQPTPEPIYFLKLMVGI